MFLGFVLNAEHCIGGAVGLETLNELRLGAADRKVLFAQQVFEFGDGLAFKLQGLTRPSLGFLVQEVGGQRSLQTSSPVQRRPMSCSYPSWSRIRAMMKSTMSSMFFGWL